MALNLIISSEIRSVMEERGIREEDLRQAAESLDREPYLRNAEETRFLAKKRIGNFTVNMEFTCSGDDIEICNVYSYVVRLTGEQE